MHLEVWGFKRVVVSGDYMKVRQWSFQEAATGIAI